MYWLLLIEVNRAATDRARSVGRGAVTLNTVQ